MTKKDEELYKNININCRFCEKEKISHKIRNHCHLTGKYKGPAHNTCYLNVTQEQINFILFVIHNFSNFDYHLFFKKLVDKKKIK